MKQLRITASSITTTLRGDSGEAERLFRAEAERHSGMIPNTIERSDAGNSIVR
jgi:hypothetical protein